CCSSSTRRYVRVRTRLSRQGAVAFASSAWIVAPEDTAQAVAASRPSQARRSLQGLRQSTSIGSKSSCSVPPRIFEYRGAREGVEPLGQGRALLRQISRLGLGRIGADGELDIVQPGTPLGEFYRLSLAATAKALVAAGGLTADEVAQLVARFDQPDFLACGFVYIGAWGAALAILRPGLIATVGGWTTAHGLTNDRCPSLTHSRGSVCSHSGWHLHLGHLAARSLPLFHHPAK